MLEHVTNDEGEYPLNTNGDGVVYFWADWCQPCKAFAPVYEQLWNEYGADAPISKVNVTNVSTETLTSLDIRSIPTIIMFRDYSPALKLSGTKTLQELSESFDQVFNKY